LDADVNVKDNGGQTPLLRAASEGNEAAMRLLLKQKGIEVNAIAIRPFGWQRTAGLCTNALGSYLYE